MDKNNNLVRTYLFELIERCVRFYQHLEKIKSQFYENEDKNEHKLLFISSYKDCILKLLDIGINAEIDKTFNENKKMTILNKCILEIKFLHKNKLGHLPRPSEPNELKRFNRIINKQIDKFNELIKDDSNSSEPLKKETSIFMTEDIGEETFKGDPLVSYKKDNINTLIKKEYIKVQPLDTDFNNNSYHITIPRMDTYNACRWPTLLHELGHHLFNNKFFEDMSIDDHFKKILKSNSKEFILQDIEEIVDLKNWLLECWCDLFATATMGPSLWFSQYSSFIFNGSYIYDQADSNGRYPYPSPEFRLKLIKRILMHRFPNSLTQECKKLMFDSENLIMKFDKNFLEKKWIRLFHLFEKYFLQYFFAKDETKIFLGTEQFNESIEPLLIYTRSIKNSVIRDLLDDLKKGLPIPTKRLDNEEIFEQYNSIQEILLAAWIFRNTILKKRIFENIDKISNNLKDIFENKVIKEFTKFDEIVLKSIQVTEWVTIFIDNLDKDNRKEFIEKIKSGESKSQSQLVDFEIYNIIKNKDLRIIPLIDPKQIGTTSFDIRLGTRFQIYYPSQEGILDYLNQHTILSSEISSNIIDLDYLESITISPRQFMLGHSMEYLDLPNNISAELDGRSSFARSGLQIHMTAGFVEPGFIGVLTYEIFNAGSNPIRLFPGMRIGQLRFIPVKKPKFSYREKREAKYKGLLSPHRSMQSSDFEVDILSKEIRMKQINQNK
jgi:dCTP deaminase